MTEVSMSVGEEIVSDAVSESVVEETKAITAAESDTKSAKKEHIPTYRVFRIVPLPNGRFWVHNGTTGMECGKKQEGIAHLKHVYCPNGEHYDTITILPKPRNNK